jgi:SAM-dependent methyltransferase
LPIIKAIYNALHKGLHRRLDLLPFIKKEYHQKPVLKGHISGEHLENPALDDRLELALRQSGIPVEQYDIDIEGYHNYIRTSHYPLTYYGGGQDPKQNFVEKSLEHYVSLSFLNLTADSVFMDIAAATSPFADIIRAKYPVQTAYKQDLIFPSGVNGNKVGGSAAAIPLPDNSIDGATLHCSLEHFEGNADSLFFKEIERVLKPSGVLVVLPFYLAHQYTNHIDPIFNILRGHKVQLDDDPRMQLRYADWKQYFSRHYDPQALHSRILSNVHHLALTIYRVRNYKNVDTSCYLRFIGVFRKGCE